MSVRFLLCLLSSGSKPLVEWKIMTHTLKALWAMATQQAWVPSSWAWSSSWVSLATSSSCGASWCAPDNARSPPSSSSTWRVPTASSCPSPSSSLSTWPSAHGFLVLSCVKACSTCATATCTPLSLWSHWWACTGWWPWLCQRKCPLWPAERLWWGRSQARGCWWWLFLSHHWYFET